VPISIPISDPTVPQYTVKLHQLLIVGVVRGIFIVHIDIGICAGIVGLRAFLVAVDGFADKVTKPGRN